MCYHYGSFCSAEYKRTETLQCQPDSGTATDAPKLLAKRAKHAADGTSALPGSHTADGTSALPGSPAADGTSALPGSHTADGDIRPP
jgi:hypothetical protein